MQFMTSTHQYISRKDEADKVIVFERGNLVFVFNFHWSNSYFDYRVGCLKPGKYKVWPAYHFLSPKNVDFCFTDKLISYKGNHFMRTKNQITACNPCVLTVFALFTSS